ncbi:MAG: hypothetical protein D6768_14025 [Chloroflexi bacterium]|nr:MAG: hypothetical protein D6768_14025 [Chloroflexota bacterium]
MQFLGAVGTLAVIYLFYILARLSERLGSVERMPPIYRYYYVAAIFLAMALVTQFFAAQATTSPSSFLTDTILLLGHHLPLAIGATIGLVVTWRYWSWLVLNKK